MLYQSIIRYTLPVYAYLSGSRASTYYASDNEQYKLPDYSCPDNAESCHIYCDIEGWNDAENGHIYNCNNAVNCHFYCNAKECAAYVTVNGTNASNLTITQDKNGQKCLSNANIYAPNNGSAHISTKSKYGFHGMDVWAGTHTKEIIVDTTDGLNDIKNNEYVDMNIYAFTADYVHITIGEGLKWKTGIVECPYNGNNNGPYLAPCVIDATSAKMEDINIFAFHGTPKNVIIEACKTCDNVAIMCESNSDIYPFDSGSNCWWTLNPTIDPTKEPTTHDPTTAPTQNPTIDPTHDPTIIPTKEPTHDPTIDPTNDPTRDPSIDPTQYPSYPTKYPTFDPTKAPTQFPSVHPTISPTKEPTFHPTTSQPTADTKAPTNVPSVSPTDAPTDTITSEAHDDETIREDAYNDNILSNMFDSKWLIIIVGTIAALLVACVGFLVGRCMFDRGTKDEERLKDIHEVPLHERVASHEVVDDGEDDGDLETKEEYVHQVKQAADESAPVTNRVVIKQTSIDIPPPPPLPMPPMRPQAATTISVAKAPLAVVQNRPQAASVPMTSASFVPPPPPPPQSRKNTAGMMLPLKKVTKRDGRFAPNRKLLEKIADRQALPADTWKMNPVVLVEKNEDINVSKQVAVNMKEEGVKAEGVKAEGNNNNNNNNNNNDETYARKRTDSTEFASDDSTQTESDDLWADGTAGNTLGDNTEEEEVEKDEVRNTEEEEVEKDEVHNTEEEEVEKDEVRNKEEEEVEKDEVRNKEEEEKKEDEAEALAVEEKKEDDDDTYLLDDLLGDGTTAGNVENAEKDDDNNTHLLDDLLGDGTTAGNVENAGNNDDNNEYLFDIAMGHMDTTPDGSAQSDKINKRMQEVQKIKLWMENEVELGEYTNMLIMNGYDDMMSVMDISMQELEEIGIQKMGHKRKILKFTKKLKMQRNNQNI